MRLRTKRRGESIIFSAFSMFAAKESNGSSSFRNPFLEKGTLGRKSGRDISGRIGTKSRVGKWIPFNPTDSDSFQLHLSNNNPLHHKSQRHAASADKWLSSTSGTCAILSRPRRATKSANITAQHAIQRLCSIISNSSTSPWPRLLKFARELVTLMLKEHSHLQHKHVS